MSFVVDSSEWCFENWTQGDVVQVLERLLDRVTTATERQETVWIGEDLQTRPVLGEWDLWSLCSGVAAITIPFELWQELAAWLSRAPLYADETELPCNIFDDLIKIDDDVPLENLDVAWAHHNVRAKRAVACLGLKRYGPHRTTSKAGVALVHWVTTEENHREFWRGAIVVEGDRPENLIRLARRAYPDLYFCKDVWAGLGNLAGGYLALRAEIQRYLATLNDDGQWAFTCPPPALTRGEGLGPDPNAKPSNLIVQRRFRGYNLEMAPENPDVFLNTNCRQAREVNLDRKVLYCGWHGKLEPHRNRVHIHAPVSESDNKVVIGIFAQHLPLPSA